MKWTRDSSRLNAPDVSTSSLSGEAEESVVEHSLEELAEFLQADLAEIPADLEFKRTLREKLWDLVEMRNRARGRGPDRR